MSQDTRFGVVLDSAGDEPDTVRTAIEDVVWVEQGKFRRLCSQVPTYLPNCSYRTESEAKSVVVRVASAGGSAHVELIDKGKVGGVSNTVFAGVIVGVTLLIAVALAVWMCFLLFLGAFGGGQP